MFSYGQISLFGGDSVKVAILQNTTKRERQNSKLKITRFMLANAIQAEIYQNRQNLSIHRNRKENHNSKNINSIDI